MKRTKHSLSHYKLTTFDLGQLVPVACYEALPGDTIQQASSMLMRVMPQLGPVMHPCTVRLHHFFVPYRLIWDDFEPFITGGDDGEGDGSAVPTNTGTAVSVKGNLMDYLGVPPETYPAGTLSMLPFRAYNLIYNEYYRDQDLVAEVDPDIMTIVRRVAWEKDRYTTARPDAQKGPAVTLPIGGTAPITLDPSFTPRVTVRKATDHTIGPNEAVGAQVTSGHLQGMTGGLDVVLDPGGSLIADLSGATASTIVQLRYAMALQRYQEARNQYGSRYTEFLRYNGISSSDARLQRPEYLGGGKQSISFSEVLNTFGTADQDSVTVGSTQGTLTGHGIAALRSNRFRYFCEEHGLIMTLASVRPRAMYANGLHKMWSRRTKEDHYQKELEFVGNEEILKRELYFDNAAADTEVFGYNNRYDDYRHLPSQISGDFRDTFNTWHLARILGAAPTLNQSFIDCDPGKRIFAVQGTVHSLWCMINHSIQARRMVGNQTIGRIV